MTDLCIQLQPDRAGLDLDRVRAAAERLAAASPLVGRFAIVPGEAWINLMFATEQPAALWALLWRDLFGDAEFGGELRRCSMAMCEGARGWDDYLLLHHFDETQPLDRLA